MSLWQGLRRYLKFVKYIPVLTMQIHFAVTSFLSVPWMDLFRAETEDCYVSCLLVLANNAKKKIARAKTASGNCKTRACALFWFFTPNEGYRSHTPAKKSKWLSFLLLLSFCAAVSHKWQRAASVTLSGLWNTRSCTFWKELKLPAEMCDSSSSTWQRTSVCQL